MFTNIEFFILTQMRAKEKIWLFLKENRLTHDYILEKAQIAEKTFTQGTKWIFSEMCFAELGQPELEKNDQKHANSELFKDTERLLYPLNIWKNMFLSVYRTNKDHIWGPKICQKDYPSLPYDLELKPWEWTLDAILAQSTSYEVIDEWDFKKSYSFSFQFSDKVHNCIGHFDVGLLQEWKME